VARLLGADNIGHGLVIDSRTIDVGNGVTLEVSGPPLPVGQRVGWSVRSHRVHLARNGRYCARIVRSGDVLAGSRALTLELGSTTLQVAAEPGYCGTESCRVDVDPQSVQVWVAAKQG
jgi:hypothetical protein